MACIIEARWPVNKSDKENLKKRIETATGKRLFISKPINNNTMVIAYPPDMMENKEIETPEEISPGRILKVKLKGSDFQYNLLFVHAPNASGDKAEILAFFTLLHKTAQNHDNSIMCGDFNYVYDLTTMSTSTAVQNQSHHYRVSKMLDMNLKFNRFWSDVHLYHEENDIRFTYQRGTYFSRIDQIYTLEKNLNKIVRYHIVPNNFSDHQALRFDLKWGDRPIWGRGLYKFNTRLLGDEVFDNEVFSMLNSEIMNKEMTHCDIESQWERIKDAIKKLGMQYGYVLKAKQNAENDGLDQKVKDLTKKYESSPTEANKAQLDETLDQQSQIAVIKSHGARIRAKLMDFKEDERSTKFFFAKEKEKGLQTSLSALSLPDGSITEDPNTILEQVHSFYADLYGSNDPVQSQHLDEVMAHVDQSLTNSESDELNKDVTPEEVLEVVRSLKAEKSPGDDGLPAEVYRHYIQYLLPFMVSLFNKALFFGIQPPSHKRAVVKLLYKKGDAKSLKNWRPISLLNTDYKILSKILNNRLKPFLSKLVPMEQKCGVDGRNISDAIKNIVHYKDGLLKQGGYLVALDQSKAFDRVSHHFLTTLLTKMGIKGFFLNLTRELYSGITSRVCVNGGMTEEIPVGRSVRQGCPYSMTLFVLTTVPLINMIKKNDQIRGYTTKRNHCVKVQAYADDTTVIIRSPMEYGHVIDTYNRYAKASGSQLNEDKTEILKLGPARASNQNSFLSKLKPSIKILGSFFHPNTDEEQELNLDKAITKIKKFKKDYTLSLKGKILKLNTFVLSLLWHKAYVIKENHRALKLLIREIQKYLDPHCGAKIYDQVIKPIKNGGLGLIDIKARISAIKYFSILKSGDQVPETDDIIYELGTRCLKVFGAVFPGPSSFERKSPHEAYYDKLYKSFNNNELEFNEKTKPKHIEAKFKEDHSIPFRKLFGSKDPRLISINYEIAYRLLPIWSGNDCAFCQRVEESYKHLFIECGKMHMIRNNILNMINPIEQFNFNILSIYYMEGITNIATHIVISYYKRNIWYYRQRLRTGNLAYDKMDFNKMWMKIESDIRFFLQHTNNL